MRQLRYIDYDCPKCSATHTRFVYFDTEARIPLEEEVCGKWYGSISGTGFNRNTTHPVEMPLQDLTCNGVLVAREMSGVGYMKVISKGDHDFSERERERLEKRQGEHWKRQGRDEAIDRERALFKKHGAIGGVK